MNKTYKRANPKQWGLKDINQPHVKSSLSEQIASRLMGVQEQVHGILGDFIF